MCRRSIPWNETTENCSKWQLCCEAEDDSEKSEQGYQPKRPPPGPWLEEHACQQFLKTHNIEASIITYTFLGVPYYTHHHRVRARTNCFGYSEKSWYTRQFAHFLIFDMPKTSGHAVFLCFPRTEHPCANHDNVQVRLHPFPQSIHVPTMITSRSDSIHSRRASMCQP